MNLPNEVADIIMNHLDQYTLVNLTLVRPFSSSAKNSLYSEIVIDSTYSSMNPPPNQRNNVTYVKSLYSLKQLCKALEVGNYKLVRTFIMLEAPDGVLRNHYNSLLKSIKQMNLLVFYWNAKHFAVDLSNLSSNICNLRTYVNEPPLIKSFYNLKSLVLEGCNSSQSQFSAEVASTVKSLKFIRHFKRLHVGLQSEETSGADSPWKCLSGKEKFTNVTSLCFDGITFKTSLEHFNHDAEQLANHFNLDRITHFELTRAFEYQVHGARGILDCLSGKFKGLKRLSIDFEGQLWDNLPKFLANTNQLEELDLIIRFNSTRDHEWEILAHRYMDSILFHRHTLYKLSIQCIDTGKYADHNKQLPVLEIKRIAEMYKLNSLRLSTGYQLASSVFSKLPYLTHLELLGDGSGGNQHMGLQVVHKGVLDNWLRVMPAVEIIVEKCPTIRFVRVDSCLFIVQGCRVEPEISKAYQRWFDDVSGVKLNIF